MDFYFFVYEITLWSLYFSVYFSENILKLLRVIKQVSQRRFWIFSMIEDDFLCKDYIEIISFL